jgi:two-component system OmpR family response regulator
VRVLHAGLPRGDGYLARALVEAGHVVETARDLADLLLSCAGGEYDVVLIEVARPDQAPVRRIAAAAGGGAVALVVDTATAAERTRLLREGADACFLRPVQFMELEARLSALVGLGRRRAAQPPQGLTLDPAARMARMGGRSLMLPMRDYALLDYLLAHAGEVVGAEQILEHVWGEVGDRGADRVRTAVARLRARLASAFGAPMIATVRGHGYRLEANMKLYSSG